MLEVGVDLIALLRTSVFESPVSCVASSKARAERTVRLTVTRSRAPPAGRPSFLPEADSPEALAPLFRSAKPAVAGMSNSSHRRNFMLAGALDRFRPLGISQVAGNALSGGRAWAMPNWFPAGLTARAYRNASRKNSLPGGLISPHADHDLARHPRRRRRTGRRDPLNSGGSGLTNRLPISGQRGPLRKRESGLGSRSIAKPGENDLQPSQGGQRPGSLTLSAAQP